MIRVETVKANELEIERREVLRYLGYGKSKAEENVLMLIENCISEMLFALSCKACYEKLSVCEDSSGNLCFGNIKTNSKNLKRNLHGCDEIIIFTATIGAGADRIIQKYNLTAPATAVIAQAVGAVMIEKWCDILCDRFEKREGLTNKFLRPRFSPGYGDFSLEFQKQIFEMLDCPRKIGVSLTESLLMVPSKSVSAIVGIGAENLSCNKKGCEICEKKNCEYRRY